LSSRISIFRLSDIIKILLKNCFKLTNKKIVGHLRCYWEFDLN
jgi:hypothetical protein